MTVIEGIPCNGNPRMDTVAVHFYDFRLASINIDVQILPVMSTIPL